MGVPKFFRWLSKKYPTIVSACALMDATPENPNGGFEPRSFDAIYLDMNGILHNITHSITTNENCNLQMQTNFYAKLDSIFAVARPRRLVYLALDGVAPRAKMNQQRSRRFLSRLTHNPEKKAASKPQVYINQPYFDVNDKSSSHIAALIPEDIIVVDKSQENAFDFDSNCITPGTDFMEMAGHWLHEYAQQRLNSGIWSSDVIVVVSDSSVPGEGEHKIIEFIRRQRQLPNYPGNLSHLIYGLDADLIFLGLALHEPKMYVLREGSLPKSKVAGSGPRNGNSTRAGRVSKDTIFVSEIHPSTTEMELGQLFEVCGPIANVRIISEGHTKANNFGFVRFGNVTASSGLDNAELTVEESEDLERIINRALLMNGHRLRGRPIQVDRARGNNQTSLSEAEQLKILEQQDLLTVEFMSMMGIELPAMAVSILNLAKWDMEEAAVIYLEYSSSGMPFEDFIENRLLIKELNQSSISSTKMTSGSIGSSLDMTSPKSPTANMETSETSEEKANEDIRNEEDDEENGVSSSFDSPYLVVDLTALRKCFKDRFSRISCSVPLTMSTEVKQPYRPATARSKETQDSQSNPENQNEMQQTSNVESSKSVPSSVSNAEETFKSFDVERVVDDFILLGMIFGNDFLPGLPTQDIQTGSFKVLLDDYSDYLLTNDYICHGQHFNLESLARIMDLVAIREERALKKRMISEKKHRFNKKKTDNKQQVARDRKPDLGSEAIKDISPEMSNEPIPQIVTQPDLPPNTKSDNMKPIIVSEPVSEAATPSILSPAPGASESDVFSGTSTPSSSVPVSPSPSPIVSPQPLTATRKYYRHRRPSKEHDASSSSPSNASPQPSWRTPREPVVEPTPSEIEDRRAQYYVDNFPEISFEGLQSASEKIELARSTIVKSYLEGLTWVMRYYFAGCSSWEWYYPHHYAPFACDVAHVLREMMSSTSQNNISPTSSIIQLSLGNPFKPLEQLIAVLPPQSAMILPPALRPLVLNVDSPLKDFFPEQIHIQKSDGISPSVAKWHGVTRLPFISRELLQQSVASVSHKLEMAEEFRNRFSSYKAYVAPTHPFVEVLLNVSSDSETSEATELLASVFAIPVANVQLHKLVNNCTSFSFDMPSGEVFVGPLPGVIMFEE